MRKSLLFAITLALFAPACGGEDEDEARAPRAPAAGKADDGERRSDEGGPCGFIDGKAVECMSGLVCWPIGEEPGLGVCGQPFTP